MNKQNTKSTQNNRISQKQKVLSYVDKHGSINPMQAYVELGVMRLAAIVYALKGTQDELINIAGKGGKVATYARNTATNDNPSDTCDSNDAPKTLTFYCDGAAPDNQNGCKRGGVGVVAYDTHGRTVYEYSKPIIEQGGTTNSETELYALVHALTLSSGLDSIHCDNKYVVDGYNMWLDGWKEKGWLKADKKPVAHSDLWRHIAELKAARPDVQVLHVKGHAGIKGNERADELASKAARG